MSISNADQGRPSVNSRLSGFRNLGPDGRRDAVCKATGLSERTAEILRGAGALPLNVADGMIENVIGTFELPLGVAANFVVNGKDYLVPMAVEEPSVVAAASYMARIARECGGFEASSTSPVMRAQIQVLGLQDPFGARTKVLASRDEIMRLANSRDKVLVELGGGCRDIEAHVFESTPVGHMVVVHLLVDVRDAMGANTVNTMAETVAPMIEKVTGGEVRLRILSNLADLRVTRARVRLTPASLETSEFSGERMVNGIIEACALAIVDPYRAATHNKGIMNGIDPIVVATGNDWRAVEAGAHAWAARSGRYTSLSRWERDGKANLVGTLEMPMAHGLVDGATKTHPAARAALEMMKIGSAQELAQVAVAVGLAQNMAAIRALATEGIQRGHMALHARNIAIVAGATGDQVQFVASKLASEHDVRVDRAREILSEMEADRA